MKKTVALFLVLICILGMVGCNKAKYTVEIADNYPIANRLKPNYAAGEEVTVKLETITEHYYVLSVNGEEVEMDRDTSDLTYTYFTFTMPSKDVLIQIEDKWVEIPVDADEYYEELHKRAEKSELHEGKKNDKHADMKYSERWSVRW